MAIPLSDNIQTNAPKSSDSRYLNITIPYTSCSQVNSCIAVGVRYTGLTVNILGNEYWYKNGILDACLINKSVGSNTITDAINGLTKIGSHAVSLGGTITGSTIICDSRISPAGIEYGGNYSATYTARSLVDCAFVISKTSGGTGSVSLSVLTITGNSITTGFTVTHNKNKTFVVIEVVENTAPYPTVYTSVSRPTPNTVCVTFDAAPSMGQQYNILITG